LNENNTVLGLAYTFASNKLKFKDSYNSTANTSTNAFSIYATQKIASEAFIEGLFAYASTDIDATIGRISGIDAKKEQLEYRDTKNTYKVKTMIGRGLIGYNYSVDSFVISPLVGAEFISSNTDGLLFKEKDIAVASSIKSKNTVNPAVLVGARFSTEIESGDMKIIPTAGLLMKFKLSDKDMQIDQALDGTKGSYTYKKNKVSKLSVAPSVGVTMKQNQIEYSASYAADISTKYLGHNAGLKVKINF
jgi:outer membrane autotransporter protein